MLRRLHQVSFLCGSGQRMWTRSRLNPKYTIAVIIIFLITYSTILSTLQDIPSFHRKEVDPRKLEIRNALDIIEVERKGIFEVHNVALSPPHVFKDFPFRYSMPDGLCGKGVKVVHIVSSEVDVTFKRGIARETWATPGLYKNTSIKTIFMVGLSSTLYYQRRLYLESKYFKDIVQVDIKDSSHNQTLKTLAALHWTQKFCPEAKWLVKTDSNVFLNPFAIQNYLKNVSGDFVCRTSYNASVCRPGKCRKTEVELAEEEYLGSVLPRHCTGNAYIVNTATIPALLKAHRSYKRYFHLEDIYFTGILPKKVSYVDLSVHNFPLQPKTIFRHHYNGTTLFLYDVDKCIGRGSTQAIWEMILDFRSPNASLKIPLSRNDVNLKRIKYI